MFGAVPASVQHPITLAGSGSSLLAATCSECGGGNFTINIRRSSWVYCDEFERRDHGGGGRRDFAIGEMPLTEKQRNNPSGPLAQIPVAVFSIVPVYKLPWTTPDPLYRGTAGQIYMGHIKNWRDQRIVR